MYFILYWSQCKLDESNWMLSPSCHSLKPWHTHKRKDRHWSIWKLYAEKERNKHELSDMKYYISQVSCFQLHPSDKTLIYPISRIFFTTRINPSCSALRTFPKILPWRAGINPSSSFMSNRLLQVPSLIGWLLQRLLLIGWMSECRRVTQVQNITSLIRANYKQVCQQRRQERWLSTKGRSSFWGRGTVTRLNTRGGASWSELNCFNKFCLFPFYKAGLGGRQFQYGRDRFKVAERDWVTQHYTWAIQSKCIYKDHLKQQQLTDHSCQLIKSVAFQICFFSLIHENISTFQLLCLMQLEICEDKGISSIFHFRISFL